jgi:hypothetical protein
MTSFTIELAGYHPKNPVGKLRLMGKVLYFQIPEVNLNHQKPGSGLL